MQNGNSILMLAFYKLTDEGAGYFVKTLKDSNCKLKQLVPLW